VPGVCAFKTLRTSIAVTRGGGIGRVLVTRQYVAAGTLPGVWIRTLVSYPQTPRTAENRGWARLLETEYDRRWREVGPCEIRPDFPLDEEDFRIWKHNYRGDVTSYALDQHRFSANRRLSSANNHISNGWVAVSQGRAGLLVAQSVEGSVCFAFCPLRAWLCGKHRRVRLNPLGTYAGPQRRYPTATTGLGRMATIAVAGQLRSLAPSYAGHTEYLSLLLAPYSGSRPPDALVQRAMGFSVPPLVLSCDGGIPEDPWLTWADQTKKGALGEAR
jgi:hypothetical protein